MIFQTLSSLSLLTLAVFTSSAVGQLQVLPIGLGPLDNSSLLTGQMCEPPRAPCHRTNVFCNADHKCECDFGYVPVPANETDNDTPDMGHPHLPRLGHPAGRPAYPVKCVKLECAKDADCKRFGSSVTCDGFKQCSCPSSSQYAKEQKDCLVPPVKTVTKLGDTCNGVVDTCGNHATCASGQCMCQNGYTGIPNGQAGAVDCEIHRCSTDRECRWNDQHSICNKVSLRCTCMWGNPNGFGLNFDPATQKCLPLTLVTALPELQ